MTSIEKDSNAKFLILLVDDYEEMAKITGTLLRTLGFRVHISNNGKECIELAETLKPDILLLDIEMPVMDGFTVCEHIRKQGWGKTLPIVALTGYGEEHYNGRNVNDCFDKHLVKPVILTELSSTIHQVISEKARRRGTFQTQ